MPNYSKRQGGFALIVSMIILVVLTILVVSSVRTTSYNERMAFSYMDNALARQAAEEALREGGLVLMTNAALCAANTNIDPAPTGCAVTNSNGVAKVDAAAAGIALPSSWADVSANKVPITTLTGQTSKASYAISLLNVAAPANCFLYSIMAQGQGNSNTSTVVLQTVAQVCSH